MIGSLALIGVPLVRGLTEGLDHQRQVQQVLGNGAHLVAYLAMIPGVFTTAFYSRSGCCSGSARRTSLAPNGA